MDDPIIICNTEEGEAWFHAKISDKHDTKGINRLTPSNPIDYLSIRITLRDDGTLTLDNEAKINIFLAEQGMGQCNESKTPLTREALRAMHMGPETTANKQGIKRFQSIIGDGNWLVQTTHPTLATATLVAAHRVLKSASGDRGRSLATLCVIPEEGSSIRARERPHEQGRLRGVIRQ